MIKQVSARKNLRASEPLEGWMNECLPAALLVNTITWSSLKGGRERAFAVIAKLGVSIEESALFAFFPLAGQLSLPVQCGKVEFSS